MSETKIDLSKYHNALSRKHQLIREVWNVVWTLWRMVRPYEWLLDPEKVEKPDWIYID